MTGKDKIDVIQKNIESLRNEIKSRIESDLKIGQTVVAGVAAILVLKNDADIKRFLPLLPILGLLLVLLWQRSEFSLFRLGRRLMDEEAKVNGIATIPLLTYETEMWHERKEWFNKLIPYRFIAFCLGTLLSGGLICVFMKDSYLKNSPVTEWGTYTIAAGIVLSIFSIFRRECRLFKPENQRKDKRKNAT